MLGSPAVALFSEPVDSLGDSSVILLEELGHWGQALKAHILMLWNTCLTMQRWVVFV